MSHENGRLLFGTSICSEAYDSISAGKWEQSWVPSFSGKPPPSSSSPSIQLPVLLSLEAGVFRLQGFVLELVTSRPRCILAFHQCRWVKWQECVCKNQSNIQSQNQVVSTLRSISLFIFCRIMSDCQWVISGIFRFGLCIAVLCFPHMEHMSISMRDQVFHTVSRFHLVLKVHKSYFGCGERIFLKWSKQLDMFVLGDLKEKKSRWGLRQFSFVPVQTGPSICQI